MDELAPPAHQVAVFPGAKNGEQTEQVSTPEAAADEDEAFDPADFVRGLPMICCQCFAVEDLVRVGDPHWSVYCVRCRPVDGEVVT